MCAAGRLAGHSFHSAGRLIRAGRLVRRSVFPLSLLCLLSAACERGPVEWEEPTTARQPAGPPARMASDSVPLPPPPLVLPAGSCQRSPVFARMAGTEWYAAWWKPRPDSSSALVVARSVDGGRTWAAPVTADARDRSARGCSRPAPAIAADSASGYVHLAYFLEPSDGAGMWFTHSMEQGALWHAPVGIVYGERPGRTSVAVAGDTVVVAFEYPSAVVPRVGLAVSRTAGHTFEERMPVSSGSMAALAPRVALRGRQVLVSWTERSMGADTAATDLTMLRVGRLRTPQR